VKFLSILLSKKILTTIGTRKNTEKSWLYFQAQQLCPIKNKVSPCVAQGHTEIACALNLEHPHFFK
jgi:hypothetical protein